ncbi:MAG: amidohydrolase [Bacilli bacterium]|nr:amidohydrolase [Bacilli bacterium]
MKILLKNAKILTLRSQNILDGEILVDGNKIAQIAQKINVKADRVIDCEGNLLMPGFKNAHAHSAMVFARGLVEDVSLDTWLKKYMFPIEAKFQKNDIYHLSKLAYLEYLESGITANFDMYFFINEIKKASEEFGMRTSIVLIPMKSSVERIAKQYRDSHKDNNLVKMELGFHADYTMSDDELKAVSKVSHQFKAPLYMHCSESKKEVEDRKKTYKLTPVEYLNKFGIFDYGGGIFHGVHLSKNDMKILKQHNVAICTCPISNLKLANGIAPIKELTQKDIMVAVGTDGAGSNNSLDMFKEMQLVILLSKYRENNPASLKTFDVLKMATVNSAHFMNLNNCDVLAKGKLADIIMIDLHAPNMRPSHSVINNLVYSASKSNVMMTMIDGKILYYKHKFYLSEDIKKIYQNAEKVIKRLTKKN